jgi:hypothetical protein
MLGFLEVMFKVLIRSVCQAKPRFALPKRENLPSCSVIVYYVNTLVNHIEKRVSSIKDGIKQSYDASVKLMLVNNSKKTNNCSAARQFRLLEGNIRSRR